MSAACVERNFCIRLCGTRAEQAIASHGLRPPPHRVGAVASLVTLLLHEHGVPEGLGPLHCVAIGPAAVMSDSLAAAAAPLVTSVCLR